MHREGREVMFAAGELDELVAALDIPVSELGLGGGGSRPTELGSRGNGDDLARRVAGALAAPAKRVRFHWTLADELAWRTVVAWRSPDTTVPAVALDTNGILRVSEKSPGELVDIALDVLVPEGVRNAELGIATTAAAAFVWLAVVEHLRMIGIGAFIDGRAPIDLISRGAVRAQIDAAAGYDYRSLFSFATGVMPVPFGLAITDDEIADGLQALTTHDLLEALDDTGAAGIYELSATGAWLADELLAEVAKVGIGESAYRSDGILGHESSLIVRTPFHLILFAFSGADAVIASVAEDALDAVLSDPFASPTYPLPAGGRSSPPDDPISG
ncbi:MAG: hypothetical protein BMS9Abin20_0515 [Acidimicrobiia bacterium]|nr:MAG: hypothetical protein BMS9Abin20_0515 [Acidimicrobiia bacterium]